MSDRRPTSSEDATTTASDRSDPGDDRDEPRGRDESGNRTDERTEADPKDENPMGEKTGDSEGSIEDEELASLRAAVEEKYDFESFGPEEMAEMSYDEWEAVFDSDSWITGEELLGRVETDLKQRIATREVFARIERLAPDPSEGEPERLLVYSDEGYALVYPDGSVDGRGTVLRDVKPTVALCSMDDYEVGEIPEDGELPAPSAVPEGSGELGNFMLQVIAAIQLLAAVGLFVAWIFLGVETIFAPVLGLAFLITGVFLFLVVANARLSDRFRAEEYRNRLRAMGLESDERPEFLPEEVGDTERTDESETT